MSLSCSHSDPPCRCSVDGLHPSDLTQWATMAPNGSIAQLYNQGTFYNNYYIKNSAADSFPGLIGPTTGS